MRDDPHRNLKWLERELLDAERPAQYLDETAELLSRVDQLLEDDPEPPVFVRNRKKPTRGERMEQSHISQQFDPSAAVLTKTRRQLRKEARAQKKANVNRNIKGLVVLAVLEIIGILCILGWWLQ